MRPRVVFLHKRATRVVAREHVLPDRVISTREIANVVLVVASLLLFLLGLGWSQKAAETGVTPAFLKALTPR